MGWGYFLTHFLPMAMIATFAVSWIVYFFACAAIGFAKKKEEPQQNKTLRSVT